MRGGWTTVNSYTEREEDPNPQVWYDAAESAPSWEEALYFFEKGEYYHSIDTNGKYPGPKPFLKQKLYKKFHDKEIAVAMAACSAFIFFIIIGAELAVHYDSPKSPGIKSTQSNTSDKYQREKERNQLNSIAQHEQKVREELFQRLLNNPLMEGKVFEGKYGKADVLVFKAVENSYGTKNCFLIQFKKDFYNNSNVPTYIEYTSSNLRITEPVVARDISYYEEQRKKMLKMGDVKDKSKLEKEN